MLYSSCSIGISQYSQDLISNPPEGVHVVGVCVGGSLILSHKTQSEQQLHLLSCLDRHNDVTHVHIQHDIGMFSSTDQYESFENLAWLINTLHTRGVKVSVTFHGIVNFPRHKLLREPIQWITTRMLEKLWSKQVITALNKCDVLVHSRNHQRTLIDQGVKRCVVWSPPVIQHKQLDTDPVDGVLKLVIPGGLSERGYKNVSQAIELCAGLDNHELYIDCSDPVRFKHYEKIAADQGCVLRGVRWSPDREEYIEQLCEFDVSLCLYSYDIPLSGGVIDSLSCGLITVTHDTSSRQELQTSHDCLLISNDTTELQQLIVDARDNSQTRKRLQRHINNFITYQSSQQDRLKQYYNRERIDTTLDTTKSIYTKSVKSKTNMYNYLPRHSTNVAESLIDMDTPDNMIMHVEHHFQYNKQTIDQLWCGLLHGPVSANDHTTGRLACEQLLQNDDFNNSLDTCECLYVTNTRLLDWWSGIVSCEVKLMRIESIRTETNFSVDVSRTIVDAGWWCRDHGSIFKLEVPDGYNKMKIVKPDEPVRELIDYSGCVNNTVKLSDQLPNDYVMFIDQTTDDVVDDSMINCMSINRPMLIRRNSTTQEYLGDSYPLLFDNIKQAGELLTDDNIAKAIQYLK